MQLKVILILFISPCGLFSQVNALDKVAEKYSTNHLSIWFNHEVRYYENEGDSAYTRDDLAVMIKVVSQRFQTIVVEPAPRLERVPVEAGEDVPNKIWVPSLVAEINRDRTASKITPIKVMISFDFKFDNYMYVGGRRKDVTSFQSAKFMADNANSISPGTVDTLLFNRFLGRNTFASNLPDIKQAYKELRNGAKNSTNKYAFGVTIDLSICGEYLGPLGDGVKDILSFVDIIVVVIHKVYGSRETWPKEPNTSLEMFEVFVEDCERKLKRVKKDIKVIPMFTCSAVEDIDNLSQSKFLKCWEMMGKWAEANEREVIMYEAFDNPKRSKDAISSIRHRQDPSLSGWWRVKDITEYSITEDMFVEKMKDLEKNKKFPEDIDNATRKPCKMTNKPQPWNELESEDNLDSALCTLSVLFTLLILFTTGLLSYLALQRKHERTDCKGQITSGKPRKSELVGVDNPALELDPPEIPTVSYGITY